MAKKPNIIRACEKCGKPQKKDESKSNNNWNVYDTQKKCECGGNFQFMLKEKQEELLAKPK